MTENEHHAHVGQPPPPPLPHGRRLHGSGRASLGCGLGLVALIAVVIFIPLFIWFGCRIEPRSDEIAILVRKTGENLPLGQVIAREPGQRGIQLEVLPEGRYFKNPYHWGWKIRRITDIPAGKLGVVAQLFGENLPHGQILASEGTKGIQSEIMRPGKYRFNPYAYSVEQFDAITVRPGHVGVITALTGQDVLSDTIPDEQRNQFLVSDAMKGVQARVLDPGTYYLNPYVFNVVEVNLQSQRFEMSGTEAISFLTLDGFTVTVEGTIEFAIERVEGARLTHRVGDMDDITKKVILPRARGFSRIEGSKHPAIDFIVGETRQKFQNDLETHLQTRCVDWGVNIKSVLIRKIIVPEEIASISREREVAVQDAKKFEQQIEQARSKAELAKQETLAEQNKAKVEADTKRIRAVIIARQEEAVQVIAANKQLAVAKVDNEAATFRAEAIVLEAQGERDATKARNEAEAAVVRAQVEAFESGAELARYTFYERIAPRVQSVLSSDAEGGLGAVFLPYLPTGKEVAK